MGIVSRIAPTPSGYLHLGNLFNFVFCSTLVKSKKGKLYLRIDDIDNERFRPEYLNDIFRVIEKFKIDVDGGPSSPDDFYKNFRQCDRVEEYRIFLQGLLQNGLPSFSCNCSRKELSDPKFTMKHEACMLQNEWKTNSNLRVSIDENDFIVWKKNNFPSYQLVSLCEDTKMGINLIVRGADLLPSTKAQLYLDSFTKRQALAKAEIVHHSLLLSADGTKLSKSVDSPRVGAINDVEGTLSMIKDMIAKELQNLGINL